MTLQGKENSLKFLHTSPEVVSGVMIILLKPTSKKKKKKVTLKQTSISFSEQRWQAVIDSDYIKTEKNFF